METGKTGRRLEDRADAWRQGRQGGGWRVKTGKTGKTGRRLADGADGLRIDEP